VTLSILSDDAIDSFHIQILMKDMEAVDSVIRKYEGVNAVCIKITLRFSEIFWLLEISL
jgi:hypothetical protein